MGRLNAFNFKAWIDEHRSASARVCAVGKNESALHVDGPGLGIHRADEH